MLPLKFAPAAFIGLIIQAHHCSPDNHHASLITLLWPDFSRWRNCFLGRCRFQKPYKMAARITLSRNLSLLYTKSGRLPDGLQVQGPNGLVARSGWEGIAATAASRIPRDVRGQDLDVIFDIVDLRPPAALARPLQEGATAERNARGPYRVTATLQASTSHLAALLAWSQECLSVHIWLSPELLRACPGVLLLDCSILIRLVESILYC